MIILLNPLFLLHFTQFHFLIPFLSIYHTPFLSKYVNNSIYSINPPHYFDISKHTNLISFLSPHQIHTSAPGAENAQGFLAWSVRARSRQTPCERESGRPFKRSSLYFHTGNKSKFSSSSTARDESVSKGYIEGVNIILGEHLGSGGSVCICAGRRMGRGGVGRRERGGGEGRGFLRAHIAEVRTVYAN